MNISARQILMPKNERALKQKVKVLVSSGAEKLRKQVNYILALLFFKLSILNWQSK